MFRQLVQQNGTRIERIERSNAECGKNEKYMKNTREIWKLSLKADEVKFLLSVCEQAPTVNKNSTSMQHAAFHIHRAKTSLLRKQKQRRRFYEC